MAYLSGLTSKENARIAYCQGCYHLSSVSGYGCCDYIFNVGRRRPCKFGKGCTEKRIEKKKRAYTVVHKANGLARRAEPKKEGKPYHRAMSWDTERARRMYERGAKYKEIAEALGNVTEYAVGKFARRHGWTRDG